jgi:hypothetical protein
MLLTGSKAKPLCMSLLFHTVLVKLLFVSLVVLSSTVCFFPFAPSFVLILPISSPNLESPSDVPFYFFCFVFFDFLFGYYCFLLGIIYGIILSVLCLVPRPFFFVWGPPGLRAADSSRACVH